MKFKKGDLVTRIASWDQFGTVFVTHFVVSSWGAKQATLIKVNDGSNAKFRVYTEDAIRVQGIRSSKIIPTADYSDALAMQIAEEFIVDEDKRAEQRLAWSVEHFGDDASRMAHEQGVYSRHKAVAWKAAVVIK